MRLTAVLLVATAVAAAGDSLPPSAATAPLKPLQEFIGVWKGVGQVERGSNRGAWIEQADWHWKFADGGAAIVFAAPESKHLVEGRISKAEGARQFSLTAKLPTGQAHYSGTLDVDGALVFAADPPAADAPKRISIRLRAEGARMVVLLERGVGDGFARIAEIGYTRVGSDFGKGSNGPECIVTGGAGTIPVAYKGTTYYVCCSGCKELFEAEPEKILAEYRERKKLPK